MSDGQATPANPLGLAYLTVAPVSPPDLVTIAAEAGYERVGLRIVQPREPPLGLLTDMAVWRETEHRLRDTGVEPLEAEALFLTPTTEPASLQPLLDLAARLGARFLLTLSQDPDESRTAANLAELAARGAPLGLQVVLEFARFTAVKNLAQALRVVELTGRPDTGVLVDALHLARSGGTPVDLAAVPAWRLPFVQVCDARASAPADDAGLAREAVLDRLAPGEGVLPLGALLAALPEGVPLSIEAPTQVARAQLEKASAALRAMRRLLQSRPH